MPPKVASAASNRVLPVKEAKLFRELLTEYEAKQYKKGLKAAESILKKHPEHGETLCMKGIIYYNLGKKEEGFDLVRKGIKLDLTSHICWHVKALLHKADRDPEQAMACYSQAIKIEKDQYNILRDLVHLQYNFRLFTEAVEQRVNMVRLQPRMRINWLGLAVTYHLAGRFDDAHDVLTHFEGMEAGDPPKHDYEMSELYLYHALVLEEAGRPGDALALLDDHAARIVDRFALERFRARLYQKTGAVQSAKYAWNTLLEDNADNYENLHGFLSAHGYELESLDDENRGACLAQLDELAVRLPRSLAIRRTVLRVAQGDTFRKRANLYLTDFLVRGVPSLFVDIRSLYTDEAKRSTIESLVEGYRDTLERKGTLSSDAVDDDDAIDSPTTYVWVLYFLAQHYNHLDRSDQALAAIDAALRHTPSLPDFHFVRARVLKRAGDRFGAEKSMEAARALDGQDRFLNCKVAKYLCRCDRPEDAEKMVGLFTRAEAKSPLDDLVDMQALWFLQEQGEAFRRQGRLHLALKRFHQVEKIFADWREDETDFHSWCLRKFTLRAYIRMLRWEDQVRDHATYLRAATGAVEIYFDVHRKRTAPATNGVHTNGDDDEAERLAEEERRKAAKKAKKASAKAAKANDVKKPAATAEEEPLVYVDPDPEGHKLLEAEDPLEVALRFVRPLETMAPRHMTTWLLSYRVAMARGKRLQALKSLQHAHAIDTTDPELHVLLADFFASVSSSPAADELEDQLIKDALKKLTRHEGVDAANGEMLQRHAGSAAHIVAAARALVATGKKAEAESVIFQLLSPDTRDSREASEAALSLLRGELASGRADEFCASARTRYPLATAFMTALDLQAHLEQLAAPESMPPPLAEEEHGTTATSTAA